MRAIYHRFIGMFDWQRGWLMVYLIGNEAAKAKDHRQAAKLLIHLWAKTNGVHGYLRPNSWFLTKSANTRLNLQTYRLTDFIYFLRSCKEKQLLLKPCREIGQRFEESLRGGNLVQKLVIFRMNNKTIIGFGFRRMRTITQILEDVIHLRYQPHWTTSSSICIFLHILLSLVQYSQRSPCGHLT